MVSEEEIIQLLTYVVPSGAVASILFQFLRLKQKDREIELQKQKKEQELSVQTQLKKLETLLESQKYYMQAASSAWGLREHLSDEKLRKGIKPFFRLWEFLQRRHRALDKVGFYFFSQRKAEKLVQKIEKIIIDNIRNKIDSDNFTRLEQLEVANIDGLEKKCNSDPKIKEIRSKFLEFMNSDLDSFNLHLKLYANVLLYLVNDMFKDWYEKDDEFSDEHQRLREEINDDLKSDKADKEIKGSQIK